MSYVTGGLIQAADYNGFVGTNPNNVNTVWGTGSGNFGYGQTPLTLVLPIVDVVTATQWATLINDITTAANHQGTTISPLPGITIGDTISVINVLSNNIDLITTNRGNAYASGTQYIAWTGNSSYTSPIPRTPNPGWQLQFQSAVKFGTVDAARYFFNAGGLIKVETSKSSTGAQADIAWNNLADVVMPDVYISGGWTTQTIAGVPYTGVTLINGGGSPISYNASLGYYNMTTSEQTLVEMQNTGAYTEETITVGAYLADGGATVYINVYWTDTGNYFVGSGNEISGGSATTGIAFGTAPATVVTYFPPESNYLTNSWGTPLVTSSAVRNY